MVHTHIHTYIYLYYISIEVNISLTIEHNFRLKVMPSISHASHPYLIFTIINLSLGVILWEADHWGPCFLTFVGSRSMPPLPPSWAGFSILLPGDSLDLPGVQQSSPSLHSFMAFLMGSRVYTMCAFLAESRIGEHDHRQVEKEIKHWRWWT